MTYSPSARFAAESLASRLNLATNGSDIFSVVAAADPPQQPTLAVGFGAAAALPGAVVPTSAMRKLTGDDDAYFLAMASDGSIALAAGKNSGRGALNAVYGFLRDALGIYILTHNVTDVPALPLRLRRGALTGRVVAPSFAERDYLARAALPCSSDWGCSRCAHAPGLPHMRPDHVYRRASVITSEKNAI
jgi:hypothetical protein